MSGILDPSTFDILNGTPKAVSVLGLPPFYKSSVIVRNLMNPQIETPTHVLDDVITREPSHCILVVEDDRSVADMLESLFRTWSYEVRVAGNGQEGLDIVATQSVDGIFLDMHMPIMDGRTMLDELRWLGYQLPVWVMSGGSDVQALRQLLHEGAQGFLIKPFQLQSLQQSCAQIFSSIES
jgi:CheY-like chemotaxis protein